MSELANLIRPDFVISTGAGAGVVWAVVKVYLRFIMRDLEKLEARVVRLERMVE